MTHAEGASFVQALMAFVAPDSGSSKPPSAHDALLRVPTANQALQYLFIGAWLQVRSHRRGRAEG